MDQPLQGSTKCPLRDLYLCSLLEYDGDVPAEIAQENRFGDDVLDLIGNHISDLDDDYFFDEYYFDEDIDDHGFTHDAVFLTFFTTVKTTLTVIHAHRCGRMSLRLWIYAPFQLG